MSLDPARTVFVLLSFEGPDVYSLAGGLGVRETGLSRTLARHGYQTYLYFCGDPDLPSAEERENGRLHLRRWCQWISAQHPGGVYDGEEGKIRDWNYSLPPSLVQDVVEPAANEGMSVVILGEDWQTAWTMKLISDALFYRGLRERAVMLWNANGLFGFHRVDWGALNTAATVTTVSRYMKFRMWEWGQNPVVIPNGIPRESIVEPDLAVTAAVRAAAGADHLWFKIGRFHPDKRWLMAVSAAAEVKRRGQSMKLVIRGDRGHHATEVMAHAAHQGLAVRHVESPAGVTALVTLLRESREADVVNLTTFLDEATLVALYSSVDAVLANSGHEPFGLVGLEVMAAGGLPVTGATGEDYAEAYRNAVVLETEDALEIVTELVALKDRPKLAAEMRRRGRATARDYLWDKVVEQLLLRVEFAAARQGVKLPDEPAQVRKRVRKADAAMMEKQ
jgi:glycosyltransferase involved in cell wall biosynthesis